jgi:hypothetical protein
MAEKRKRNPGAGRPPQGPIIGKVAVFSTRITAETRTALESEAEATGRSISQVAEEAMDLGLETKRERAQSNPTKALTYLVGRLADECSFGVAPTGPHFEWNNDTFVFEALIRTLSLLLEQLRPSESPLRDYLATKPVHPDWRELFATPESWARHVFWRLWDEVAGTRGGGAPSQPVPFKQLLADFPEIPREELVRWFGNSWSEYKARRDLGLDHKRSNVRNTGEKKS